MTDLARTLALDETRIGYHFVGATLRDGRPVPPDGEWLEHDGKVVMCNSGLHASRHPLDALQFAPGSTLCLVECEDIVTEHDDKLVCRRRRIVARIDATDLLWRAAREYAQAVLHLWDAPQVVKDFLASGDESLSAAAWDAAWDAARDAQRTIFQRLVDEAFCHVANTEAS